MAKEMAKEMAKWGQVIVRHIASLCVTAGKSYVLGSVPHGLFDPIDALRLPTLPHENYVANGKGMYFATDEPFKGRISVEAV